jgi:hypothetical protein
MDYSEDRVLQATNKYPLEEFFFFQNVILFFLLDKQPIKNRKFNRMRACDWIILNKIKEHYLIRNQRRLNN